MDKFLVRAAVREAENFFALVVPLMNGSLDTDPLLFPLEPGIYPCSSQTSKLATEAFIIHVSRMLCMYTVHVRSYAWPTGRLAQRLGLARYALCIRIGRARMEETMKSRSRQNACQNHTRASQNVRVWFWHALWRERLTIDIGRARMEETLHVRWILHYTQHAFSSTVSR